MGRPSKLTDPQWAGIEKRLLAGEKAADLAREFKVSPAQISRRFSQRIETVKAVANQLVGAEQSLRALPVAQQVAALTLADELRAISMHMAGAAKYGSATAHRLLGIAHGKVAEIDDASPLTPDSIETLKSISALTRLANDSAVIPSALLAANKEAIKDLSPKRPQPARVIVEVMDASLPED